MKPLETINWDPDEEEIQLIDQTGLPGAYRLVRCTTVNRLIEAIKRLEVRGAPALGVAGAYGVALAARNVRDNDFERYMVKLAAQAEQLKNARPTAVNLAWGVDLVMARIRQAISVLDAKSASLEVAHAIASADVRVCHNLGDFGAEILPDKCTILTHCNAGALACKEWGTALGVVRSGIAAGKKVRVIACETRPLLQGARLTAWELARDGIDVTVITDSSAAHLMRAGDIDLVLVGADRITPDVAFNKIGTYMHAVCAAYHKIPFYVAAPLSTFDPDHSEIEITIEERGRDEIAMCGNRSVVPENAQVLNLAFDATPHSLVAGFITEIGILHSPLDWDEITDKRQIIE
ncbi:MAG TPA: S-methyl-5-thioribose-1-phosphate isomerase [Methanoregulaceae archaeon]|nr:S-methyl-5-thioribose-1-phosphate isomerase [Methanoregulaceae archaeon]